MANCTLKVTSLLVAIIDMVGAAVICIYAIIAWGLEFIREVRSAGDEKYFHDVTYSDLYRDSKATASLTALADVLLVCMVKMYLGFALRQGIERNNLVKCKIWLLSTAILVVLFIAMEVYRISQRSSTIVTSTATIDVDGDSSQAMSSSWFFGVMMIIMYETFCIFIISLYMRQAFAFARSVSKSPGFIRLEPVRLELNGKPMPMIVDAI